jgi:peptide chain release factor subunit 1
MQTTLKQMLNVIEQKLKQNDCHEFKADADRVLQVMADYKPRGQSVAIFCDDSENFCQMHDLHAPIRRQAWWEPAPHLRPLFEVIEEYERFGVILTDKTQARLFIVFLGEIEEWQEAFAEADVKQIKAPAKDRLRSQLNMQRKAEMHVQWHLKHVAETMARFAQAYEFDRLVLAGPVEATSELRRLLSKRLHSRVVGTLSLPVQASAQQVLEETLKIEEEVERTAEIALVEDLLTAAAKHKQATQGLQPTLRALRENRIWRLVYVEGFNPRGKECPKCSSLATNEPKTCKYCGTPLKPLDDLIERMAEKLIENGGKTEMVCGVAAERLKSAGGIGAFLRFS